MSKKIISVVRENKNKQRRVTIPKEDTTLKDGDVVEIIKDNLPDKFQNRFHNLFVSLNKKVNEQERQIKYLESKIKLILKQGTKSMLKVEANLNKIKEDNL